MDIYFVNFSRTPAGVPAGYVSSVARAYTPADSKNTIAQSESIIHTNRQLAIDKLRAEMQVIDWGTDIVLYNGTQYNSEAALITALP